MSAGDPDEHPEAKRKPPIWPWLVLLVVTLAVIYAHHQVSMMIDDLTIMGRDLVQLFEWLLPELPD